MNNNTKMILLFILLSQLMIGIACASEVQNEHNNTIEKQTQQTINPSNQEINNNIKTTQKTIKTNNNKNIKTTNNTNTIENKTQTNTTTKRNVKITVNPINGIIGENITLKANITDNENKAVTGGNIVFKLNGKTLKTDGSFNSTQTPWKFQVKNGLVTTTIKADLYLRNTKNITASYSGTNQSKAAKSRTITVQIKKRNAQLTVTTTPKKQKHYETITIKTIIKDTTKEHKNKTAINTGTKVLLKIDGKTLKNNKGKKILLKIENNTATYNYTIPQVMKAINNDGTTKNHTIEAVLVSDTYYPNTRNNTKFSVYRNPTKIIINNITNATVKKNVKITGKLVDKNNQPVISKKIQLKINNQKYIIKTDKTGAFQKTIKANKTGTNNITVISPGNANYLSTKTKTTFKVNRINTIITFKILNESKLRAGKSICVRGKITDEDGNPVKEEFVYVYPSLSEYKIRYGQYGYMYQWMTDEKGKFDCEKTLLSAGSNQLIVVFEGNEIFAPAKRIKNYTSAKFMPEIYIETDIMPLKVGETINIYGEIIPTDAYYDLDELYIDLNNITLEARFNNENKTQKAILKDDGHFNVYYKTNLVGTNKVTIKLSENQEFHETINSTTFYVYNKTASKVVLPIKKHRSEISNEYEKYIIYNNGNKDYGEIEAQVNNLLIYDALPVNKIVGAKLYLKNSKNQTKTINGTIENKFSVVIKHDPKLTPYKIELQLKQLSKREDAEYFY